MKRRLFITVVALILAGAGTSGVVSYVKGANTRALQGVQPVSVLVAQKKIPAGTTVAAAVHEGLLAVEKLPAATVPVNSLSSVPASLDSLTFSADVQPGQELLRPMLVQATQLTSGMAIPSHMLAVTIDFCLSEVVAGAVQAGSEVAVFDTIGSGGSGNLSANPGCAGAHQQVAGNTKTRLVLPRVLVLSVGASAASAASGPATTGLGSAAGGAAQSGTMVTLAVSQANAERLIQLTDAGLPYLALLSPASQTTADVGNLLNIPAKAAPSGAPSPAPSPALTFPVVTPSAVPTQPAPSSAPSSSPSPSPTPSKKKHKKGK
jgi:pilus assembly protein CpaB